MELPIHLPGDSEQRVVFLFPKVGGQNDPGAGDPVTRFVSSGRDPPGDGIFLGSPDGSLRRRQSDSPGRRGIARTIRDTYAMEPT